MKNPDLNKSLRNQQRFYTVLKLPQFLKIHAAENDFICKRLKMLSNKFLVQTQ